MFGKNIVVARVVIVQIIARYVVLKVFCQLNLYDTANTPKPPGRDPSTMAKCIRNTLTRLIFAWTSFREYQNQSFLRGFIFADGQISVVSQGLIFAVHKTCIGKNCFFLFVFK